MIENNGPLTSVSLSRSTSCSDSIDDNVSSVQKFDDYYDPQAIDLPGFDASNLSTTVVKMKNSSNVEIKPITKFVIHQHFQNTNQSGAGDAIPTISEYCNPSKVERSEDSEPRVTLDTSKKKFYHAITSKLSWKLGSILILAILIIVIVLIVCLTVLSPKTEKNDSYTRSEGTYFPDDGDRDLGNDIHIFKRDRWGGRGILDGYQNRTLVHPINLVIIGHTASSSRCMTFEKCAHAVQAIQSDHVEDQHYIDVKYNFLVGGDGNIYEALGWDIQNYIRNNSIHISFFGNFVYGYDKVLDRQRMAAQALLKRGVERGKLDKDYWLVGHSQVVNTKSPGANLMADIKLWPHYYNGTID